VSETSPGNELTFEQALAELEQIVRRLEEGNVGLSESLAQYEQGVKRLKECYGLLERAERRIELLERVDADGEAVTRPFDHEATIERHNNQGDSGKPGKAKTKKNAARVDSSPAAPSAKGQGQPKPCVGDIEPSPGLFDR
jgi:exodeoxyribonuclease VII small subunit